MKIYSFQKPIYKFVGSKYNRAGHSGKERIKSGAGDNSPEKTDHYILTGQLNCYFGISEYILQ